MQIAPEELKSFCHAIPKIDIHCHLMGTLRKKTMIELARKNGAKDTEEDIENFYHRGDKPVGVLHILRRLEAGILAVPDDLYRITYEYLEDSHAHNVRYTEFFYNFTGLLRNSDNTYQNLQAAIGNAIADASVDFGIGSALIPSIDREAPPSAAVEMVELMVANPHNCVVGIGVDYNEVKYPPELFADAYALSRRHGFKTTAHAGEFGMPWTNIATALDLLKVDRLDHAYTILENPALVQRCIDEEIVITVVPTNSYYLRTLPPEEWAVKHPIREMGRLGLLIHPNTDDPTYHLTDPTNVWYTMVAAFDFDIAALRRFMMNGIAGAWVDSATKSGWMREWSAEFDALSAAMSVATGGSD